MSGLRARLSSSFFIIAVVLSLSFPARSQEAPATAPYKNPAVPLEQRVDDLIGRMTLDEKSRRCATTPRPSLGSVFQNTIGGMKDCMVSPSRVMPQTFPR